MKKEEILKLINEQIASQENLAEEYIQELDNEEDADLCFYAIEILKELKQQIINYENSKRNLFRKNRKLYFFFFFNIKIIYTFFNSIFIFKLLKCRV